MRVRHKPGTAERIAYGGEVFEAVAPGGRFDVPADLAQHLLRFRDWEVDTDVTEQAAPAAVEESAEPVLAEEPAEQAAPAAVEESAEPVLAEEPAEPAAPEPAAEEAADTADVQAEAGGKRPGRPRK